MALIVKDRVKETASAPGVGAITLLGASTGYRSFADIGDGNTTYYCIADQSGSNWELGLGTYSLAGTTLTRTSVIANSLGTTATINFFSGIQDIFCTYPSEYALLGTTQSLSSTGTGSVVLNSNPSFATDITVNGVTVGTGSNGGALAVALGLNALSNNTTGLANIAVGVYSLSSNTTGSNNIGIGSNTLGSNLIGSNNIAIGNVLGASNSDNNLAIGSGMNGLVIQSIGIGNNIATSSNVTDSVLLGINAFSNNTITSVVGIGSQVFSQGFTGVGTGSIAIGYQAGYSSFTAIQTLIGYQAGFSATARGNNNTAVGYQSLYSNGVGTASATSGANNTAIGSKTLFAQTTGRNNTAIGHQAGWGSAGVNANTTGTQNTYIGYLTVGSAATNSNEIVIGATAVGLGSNTTTIGVTTTSKATIYGVHYATNYIVGSLPAATVGARAFVTDALGPSFGVAVTGGGLVAVPVYADNAGVWTVG